MAEIRVNATGAVKFYDNDDSNFVGLQAGSISSDVTFTLPTADGSNGQALTTNGSGALSFSTISSNTPSSADGQALGSTSAEWSDLYLADGGIIYFGNDQDIRLTHNADKGLIIKHSATADDKPVILTLQTGETDMAANDVIGKIEFQAPDEGTGTDAVLVSGAIQAVAEGDHSSSSNATRLEFMTGASEAATSQMTVSSGGIVGVGAGVPGDLGVGLHVRTGDSGGDVHNDADELVIEQAGAHVGMTFLNSGDNKQTINFGDDSDNNVGQIEYDHSGNTMKLVTNTAVGVQIDSAGHVTQPLQSTFMTQQTGALSVANTHTLFSTNTTERWDVNSDLSGATFTAPVTGKYVLSVNILWESVSNDTVFEARITTSNRNYSMWRNNRDYAGGGTTYVYNGACVIADMDANDTAHVVHIGPTADVHVSGAWSWFQGYLLG